MWHASGTVKMGTPEQLGACVDEDFRVKDFRVHGIDRLRVVDMSIAPVLPRFCLSRTRSQGCFFLASSRRSRVTINGEKPSFRCWKRQACDSRLRMWITKKDGDHNSCVRYRSLGTCWQKSHTVLLTVSTGNLGSYLFQALRKPRSHVHLLSQS